MELKHLSFLDLSGNNFQHGVVPAYIETLNQLQYLNLSRGNFSGFVPHQLGNLSRLSVLDLGYNDYHSLIRDGYHSLIRDGYHSLIGGDDYHSLIVDDFTWMSRLSSLTYLDMSSVNLTLTKDLHKVLNMLPSIVSLSFQNCGLGKENLEHACVINSTIFLPNIKYLDLSFNSLDDDFPYFLENLTSLRDLDLSYNSFPFPYNSLQWGADRISKFIQNNCDLKSLYLESNFLSGDISNIFRLNSSKCLDRKLVNLDLSQNYFYGQLPTEFGGFMKLEYLNLGGNNISGPIPTVICNLSALTILNLFYNKLNGSIPSCFRNLTSLRELDLMDNQLNGSIPSCFRNLTSLRELYFSMNQLNGEIPTFLGQLKNLELLSMEDNYFDGTITESHFANLSKLQQIDIGNAFTKLGVRSDWTPPFQLTWLSIDSCEIEGGQFPKWLQTQKELTYLHMTNCNISGAIPDWFRYRNLTELVLSDNRIEGSLPESLCEMTSLRTLDLSDNRIEGSLPESLCEMTSLRTLDLSGNQLSGYLPECLANLTRLVALVLSSNQISGVIPSSIGGAYSLRWLQLSENNITGEFPSSLRNCTQLSFLDVGQNKLSGGIPKWIGKELLDLQDFRLTDNDFYGTIPFELCRLAELKLMDFANNKLTGKIPPCFGSFSNMIIGQMSGSSFSDEISSSFSRAGSSIQAVTKGAEVEYSYMMIINVAIIDLSNNDLVGEIPLELTKLDALNGINLSHNHLQGMIPGRIGEMKSLESLDFSNNNLFGSIPTSLSDLDSLGFLNLSHNNLSGEIPTGRHLQTLDNPWNYEGNVGLCGAPLLKKCNGDKSGNLSGMLLQTDEDEHTNYRIWFYGVVISGFATGFWGAIGILLFKRGWRFAYFRFADDIIERFF